MKKRIWGLLLMLLLCMGLASTANALTQGTDYTITNGHLVIADGVTAIDNNAFWNNAEITRVTIPSSVTTIGNNAFANCSSLTTVTMMGDINAIGNYAFSNCSSLTTVLYYGTQEPMAIGSNAFYRCVATVFVTADYIADNFGGMPIVPDLSLNRYQVTTKCNDNAGGTVTGGGEYEAGKTATLTATANAGYTFVNWTENGEVISTEATYSFEVTDNRTLVANFEVVAPTAYTVTYKPGANGTGTEAADTKTEGETLTLEVAIFTRIGYKQVGWAAVDGGEQVYDLGGRYTNDAAIDLYPVWEPVTDTAYTVKHHFQNIDDDGYTLDASKTENKTGTTDTLTAAEVLTSGIDGFTAPQTVEQVKIAPDGTAVVDIYYTRNAYKLTFKLDNGEQDIEMTIKFGGTITAPAAPTKDGYIFMGWADEAGNIVSFPMNMPLGGVKLTAVWEKMPDLPKTGDNSHLALWLMMMSMAGCVMLLLHRRVRN